VVVPLQNGDDAAERLIRIRRSVRLRHDRRARRDPPDRHLSADDLRRARRPD
jgi:hypothetical protein